MFENVQAAPPDPILGITEAFKKDSRAEKINLSVGVYKDENGETPVLESVQAAEERVVAEQKTKAYKPINGDPTYGKNVRELLFGEGASLIDNGEAVTCHTPGGTGALRLAGDFLQSKAGIRRIWTSDPTWANHPAIFKAAGLEVAKYRYFDPANNGLDFAGMKAALEEVQEGDAVLLHACCHNPSGVDPNLEQWKEIADILNEKKALPVIDFAYQGFGKGVQEDAAGLRRVAETCDEFLVCSSFSKNFGLYNERTGALTAKSSTRDIASAVMSQLKLTARTNYSNPPAHGGEIVNKILGDQELKNQWISELDAMRERILEMRTLFVESLQKSGASRDFSFITRQNGMFSFSGLSKEQVERLKLDYGIYIVGSGRINVAGMTPSNLQQLSNAIVAVL
ncbi:MAG: aspartate/tyrosine/aromatic aminotransferase [Polyangiaceae bacterium]|nr:aspartate/tyrosine/aromatic aminotransferase [Polyangiaceae bacterium]